MPDQLHLTVFERLTAEALDAHEPEQPAGLLRRALGLWRGPPLADLTYEPFARAPIERLEELRLAALEHHSAASTARGEVAELPSSGTCAAYVQGDARTAPMPLSTRP